VLAVEISLVQNPNFKLCNESQEIKMPRQDISYVEALARHPQQVQACVEKVRAGKSKDKDSDPATWKWTYTWSTTPPANTLLQILTHHPMMFVALEGGPSHRRARIPLDPCPEEFREWIAKGTPTNF